MEDARRRHFHPGRQWTIGLLMVVVAGTGIVCALARPFAASPPSWSGEIIGVSFDLQERRLPDGRIVSGLAPKVTVTKDQR